MEWDKMRSSNSSNGGEERSVGQMGEGVGEGNGGVLYVKVMTDEQMDVLRQQISAYATICERLVEMHKSALQNEAFNGMRLGNIYCDPMMASCGHKITNRQRWTPTPAQLQILESIFNKGDGTPTKQKITEIASELAQHGQITVQNVYNWFQNRRARSKRRQAASAQNTAESEVEMEVESSNEKKPKSDNLRGYNGLQQASGDHSLQSIENNSQTRFFDSEPIRLQGSYQMFENSSSPPTVGMMSFPQSTLSNPSMDHLLGRMELPGSFSAFHSGESYDMTG